MSEQSGQRSGPWIHIMSGKKFWPFDPRPEDVDIHDIAHHLALINRYSGASLFPVSVAQHSVLVCRLLERHKYPATVQLLGLLHDASEAYLNDMISPIKEDSRMVAYRDCERGVEKAVMQHFMLQPYLVVNNAWTDTVAHFDQVALAIERRDAVAPNPDWPYSVDPHPGFSVSEISWTMAEHQFLNQARRLHVDGA